MKNIIPEHNTVKRFQFAKELENKSDVIWETAFLKLLFQGQIEDRNCGISYGSSGVLVWGCMCYTGVANLHIINGIRLYVHIINQNLKENIIKLGIEKIFCFQPQTHGMENSKVATI